MRVRLLLAALTAPIVTLTTITLLMTLSVDWGGMSVNEIIGGTYHALFHVLVIGLPIGYFVEALFGIPAYHWLKRRERLRLLPVALVATGAGGIGFGWLGVPTTLVPLLLGMVGGTVAGVWFWLVAFYGTISVGRLTRARSC